MLDVLRNIVLEVNAAESLDQALAIIQSVLDTMETINIQLVLRPKEYQQAYA